MCESDRNPSPSRCCRHFLVALLLFGVNSAIRAEIVTNFVSENVLQDGEIETRIFHDGVYAKETAVEKGFQSTGIRFRQVANARVFVQSIYDEDGVLTDCEIIHAKNQVEKFLDEFKSDLESLVATSNLTIRSLDGMPVPREQRAWLQLNETKRNCRKLHQNLKNQAKSFRRKRSMLIVPGTYWCGHKHSASSYSKLGPISGVDRCCRRHDHCKVNIAGFSTRFDHFNLSPFTLSHCTCDSSFRACLKMVDSSDANLVGKLFFNVVQSKCFVLKPKKRCVRTTWWGKCEKFKYEKHAILRNNLPY